MNDEKYTVVGIAKHNLFGDYSFVWDYADDIRDGLRTCGVMGAKAIWEAQERLGWNFYPVVKIDYLFLKHSDAQYILAGRYLLSEYPWDTADICKCGGCTMCKNWCQQQDVAWALEHAVKPVVKAPADVAPHTVSVPVNNKTGKLDIGELKPNPFKTFYHTLGQGWEWRKFKLVEVKEGE